MSDRPSWIDTHAHLADPRLAREIGPVLDRARQAGITRIVAPGTTAEDSQVVVELARAHDAVRAAVAIHPNESADAVEADWQRIVALASAERVVAIGETGLDRYWDRAPFARQREFLDRHLDLARERGLPVVLHCRDCYPDIIDRLQRQDAPTRGVLHSFTGTWDDARALLDLGLHISFAGMITFANKALDALRDVAARVPADRLLVETDSPYLSPHPFRGRPNEPARVAITGERLAELRGIAPVELAEQTSANARRLFALPGPDRSTETSNLMPSS